MATLGGSYVTLADWAKRVDDGGVMAQIIDLQSQTNEWLLDMPWFEGNLTDGTKTTVRTGLPSGTWRKLYQGVQPSKSTTAQITERTGNLEAYGQVDKDLADLNGNTAAFRLSEDKAHIEGLGQQFSSAMAYSNSAATPEQIMGFAPRYSTLSTAVATSGNIIDAGGTGSDNCSIWIVGWGENTVHGIFPKGKIGGLQFRDLGEDTLVLTTGAQYQIYRSHFKWECGLVVRDWRYVVRICNIDVSDLSTSSAATLVNMLIDAFALFPTAPGYVSPVQMATDASGPVGPANFVIYANRRVRAALQKQIVMKPGVANGATTLFLNMREWGGMVVPDFLGVPIRTVDSLLNTEARVT